jgi:hypothetical protein
MKSNELSQSLTVEDNFFDTFKLLAIVGSAAGGLFCLYSYLNSGNTSSDKTPLNNRITNKNKDQTSTHNPPKKSEASTFTSPTPNLIDDRQLVVMEQQPGTTFNRTSIGSVYNIHNATFVLNGLPKEIEDKLESWMANWVEANLEKIQQGAFLKNKLLQEKNEELETRIAQQEKENHALKEALNIIALYALKVNMEQCDLAKVLITIEKKQDEKEFTIAEEKEYLRNIQSKTLEEAKELFKNFSSLSDAVENIEEEIIELSGQPPEHNEVV